MNSAPAEVSPLRTRAKVLAIDLERGPSRVVLVVLLVEVLPFIWTSWAVARKHFDLWLLTLQAAVVDDERNEVDSEEGGAVVGEEEGLVEVGRVEDGLDQDGRTHPDDYH
eukprot:CAMPEP_0170484612 /NCGR_PEP_ID=MMETSP0208-20121228/4029_1 /TAXON_ID=197538 /ORGANISM="Strombidium inclinatum, Strain S3" /LENGTH=109 /DNA_ID=CAMNT_0010757975 /DNA_START=877 /DNA_END=1202 /DNA_ORIENTATION=+